MSVKAFMLANFITLAYAFCAAIVPAGGADLVAVGNCRCVLTWHQFGGPGVLLHIALKMGKNGHDYSCGPWGSSTNLSFCSG
jgi:hypothetical protein